MRAVEPKVQAVVIGASAGAVEAFSRLLPMLPAGYGLPLLVVVHLPPGKTSAIAELFHTKCRIQIKEAEDKEPIRGGTVYFAPPNYHLQVEPDRCISLSNDEPVLYSRPSIDVLFESAADAYGEHLAGIVLTGANNDGARGLAKICSAGGLGIVQHPDEAHVGTMPRAALGACVGAQVMSLDEIGKFLQRLDVPEEAPGTDAEAPQPN